MAWDTSGLIAESVIGLFERAVQRAPDATALILGDRAVSYDELDATATAVALALGEAGVLPGDRVGVVAARSAEAVAALLGVFRAGGVAVPLDTAHAREQLSFIRSDIPMAALLAAPGESEAAQALAGESLPVVVIPSRPAPGPRPAVPASRGEDPALVLYTSGTTGKPKGVVLPHRALGALALGEDVTRIRPDDIVLHALPVACDGALYDIFGTLLNGAALAIVEPPLPSLDDIAAVMRETGVTVTNWYAGVHHLMIEHRVDAFEGVRMSVAGGDVMSPGHARKLLSAHPDLTLVNDYGPTEATTHCLAQIVTPEIAEDGAIPLGRPLAFDEVLVVDERLRPVAPGEEGQIAVAGPGVALGYHDRPDLTARAFVPDPRPGRDGMVYLTGDLGVERADGSFLFRGRADRQVKLNGRRIELDGVEEVLRAHTHVADAAVAVDGAGRLLGFLRAAPDAPAGLENRVRLEAKEKLNSAELPRELHLVGDFPMTASGKVDRRALVASVASAARPQATGLRSVVAEVWDAVLGCGEVADSATFFEAGGSSLQLVEAHAALEARLGRPFDITMMFEHPRLGDLARALEGTGEAEAGGVAAAPAGSHAVAVVGMAARLPGVGDLPEFWSRIRAGESLIPRFTDDELEDGTSPEARATPGYVPARPVLDGVELFDAKHFGMLPREAAVTDPQQRVFLEICQQALDEAGLDPARYPGAVGVFAGQTTSTYMLANLLPDRRAIEAFCGAYQLGDYAMMTGNDADSLATRVAFKLGLTGPALTVSTACSTSLTAIAQAVAALRSGQADAALAGGISITFPQRRGYLAQEGGMASPDGLCRPFDADAAGTVFGHGGGALVLKRLEDALAAGDHIHGVIRGVGINNDGADKIAYTAPSVTGQAEAIRAAHRDAGVEAGSVSYVECHGTATPLGDPIELRALASAFGEGPERCTLGSVKGNIGHLDAGAGVAGVIKTLLMLRAREIPPVAHFRTPNPRLGIEATRFDVSAELRPWDSNGPLRAGVSSFGVGGTNVHLVLEEAPARGASAAAVPGPQILPVSATSPEALAEMAAQLADALETPDAPALADAAFTLQDGRRQLAVRAAVVAEDHAQAAGRLRALSTDALAPVPGSPPRLAFLFPGQGAQYPGMGRGLHEAEPEFSRWIDRGLEALGADPGDRIRKVLIRGDAADPEAAQALRETRLTQPALFLVEFATAKLWEARGVVPDALAGHSVGEFTAAALSGVMSFEDALRLIARRGELMQAQPPGAMLSVRAGLDRLEPHLGPGLDLAAANAPKMQVVSGPEEAIAALEARLHGAGLPAKRLHTSHAFHSEMMEPVVAALGDELRGLALSAPRIPIVSTVTGRWMEAETATDPAYWARQARAPVHFAEALRTVAAETPPVMLEVGPGGTLSAFAAQTLGRDGHGGVLQSLPGHSAGQDEAGTMAAAFGGLWCAGLPVDWSRAGPRGTRKVSLPGVAFRRTRHWIDPPPPQAAAAAPAIAHTASAAEAETPETIPETPMPAPAQTSSDRVARLTTELLALLSDLSGEALTDAEADAPFLELGFDSLFLGQAAQAVSRDYGVEVSFRSLMTDHASVAALAAHLDAELPPEPVAPVAEATPEPAAVALPSGPAREAPLAGDGPAAPAAGVEAVIARQMQTMQEVFRDQLRALGAGASAAPQAAPAAAEPPAAASPVPAAPAVQRPAEEAPEARPFRVGRAPALAHAELTPEQLDFARDLARRYSERFPGSKAHTDAHRPVHADPRSAAGYREEWKELVFPVVAAGAKGAYIEDVDGNRFVDLVNGFGQTAFGHSPGFVTEAVSAQMEKGFPIGPQADLAGPVADRFARMTGQERVTFCNTGSEAVMAAMRLARAVTGREKIVVFANDYHGQFDEVLVKARSRGGAPDALPIAPGIPRSGLANMAVLGYGDPASLDWIRDNINDIAGVIVEPVQSRHPNHRPAEFVRELRRITEAGGAALVMDEVVTGFRTGPRGMQGVWDIEGDMATYGKVVGGGMPVGVLAGRRRFMDALDGGAWRFGDDSTPETAPTFFAGTFVRHPLVLAAVDAVLDHLETAGGALWTDAAERSAALADEMRGMLAARGLPDLIEDYSSWHVVKTTERDSRATLLFPLMRMQGVHVLDGFAGFLTTAHGAAECRAVTDAFGAALDELQAAGLLAGETDAVAAPPEKAEAPSGNIPLTEGQREIWMAHQLGDEAAASFNESVSITLEGALDRGALDLALADLVARHDALRLRFARSGETFRVAPADAPELPFADLSAEADPETAFETLLAGDAARPIRITEEPPLRVLLARLSAERHVLLLTAHHIACDGWSISVLFEDLAELYAARKERRAPQLAPAPSFAAYAAAAAERAPESRSAEFWRSQYATLPDLPDLPADAPHPPQKTWRGATVTAHVDAGQARALKKAGGRHGATLFATLFAGLQVTLGRLSGSSDVVLGVPAAGQTLHGDPRLVGHCVNLLPLRAGFDPEEPVAAHLERVRDAVLDAFEHRDYTFGTLLRELEVPRALGRLPLTEVQFNLEPLPDVAQAAGLTLSLAPNPKAAVNFDLVFNVSEGPDGLRIDVTYNTDRFRQETVRRWIGHYMAVLEALAADAGQAIAALPLMRPEEEAALDAGLNATARDYGAAPLPELIARHVSERPDAVAVSSGGDALTYAELDRRSNAIAAHLQEVLPDPSARVAVALPRTAELPAALLGVLKAGHAYVPLDPAQPAERLRTIAGTAEVAAILTDRPEAAAFAGDLAARRLSLSDIPADGTPRPVPADPERTAYIIFTSGSTGTPKGVEIPMRAMVNFLQSMAETPGFGPGDRILAVTTVSFDIAVLELFLPLVTGGEAVVATREEVLDGFQLVERLRHGDITHFQSTPTLLDMLLEAGFEPGRGLKILAGGEPISAGLAERLMAGGADLWNMYGPTETTVWSAVKRLEPGVPITIGGPIANTDLHVLDARDRPVPVGVVGELNIGGEGLARGYYNRPDLTGAAFREVDFGGTSRRLYRTGDLAVRLADGEIRVLGRKDTQVKLRGFRIELGEIEARLRAAPGVEKCAVEVKEKANGDKQLVGYFVPAEGQAPDPREMSAALAVQLPDYMVPTAWVALSALPLTANGKLDRKALPDPEGAAPVRPLRPAAAPATATERRIAEIWSDVLGIEDVPVSETVFALGADSLAVFRIAARMLDAGLDLEAKDVLAHPSIRDLAAYADSRGETVSRRPSLKAFRHGAMRGTARAS